MKRVLNLLLIASMATLVMLSGCKKDDDGNPDTPDDPDSSLDKGEFTDLRDAAVYKWVKIGDQIWMAENLRFEMGLHVTDDAAWGALGDNNTDAAWCWYENDYNNRLKYGALYTYAAAMKACPGGWHLPTEEDWSKLEQFLEDDQQGSKGTVLKSTEGWIDGNGTDNYGFKALPGGYRYDVNGTFLGAGGTGQWWSATEGYSESAYVHFLIHDYSAIFSDDYSKSFGHSVRCVKD